MTSPRRRYGLQAAIEFMLTYSWAILIIAFVLSALFALAYIPQAVEPNSCAFPSGVAYCRDILLGSNSVASTIVVLIDNSEPYPIIAPGISANGSSFSTSSGGCYPFFVLPGGVSVCNDTLSTLASVGTLVRGNLYFNFVPCQSANATTCRSTPSVKYAGTFTARASSLPTNSLTPTIALFVTNTTQSIVIGSDKLTATVKLLNNPLSGATVNFTSSLSSATPRPLYSGTDINGNAISYVTGAAAGTTIITATFAGVSASNSITFQ